MELGGGEILLILLVALLVYGGRLPEVARAIGRSLAELKRGISETRDVVTRDLDPHITDDVQEARREVLRSLPAEAELAKEDISAPDPGAPPHEQPN